MSNAQKFFFTISLLLNVIFAGVIAGHVYRMAQESPWGEISGDISPETRQIMRQVFKDKHKEIWALRDEMRGKMDAVKTIIQAEPFDLQSFEKAAREMKMQLDKSFDSRVDTFTKVFAKLTPPERQKMAQRTVDILAGHRKWDKSQGKWRDKPPEEGSNQPQSASEDTGIIDKNSTDSP